MRICQRGLPSLNRTSDTAFLACIVVLFSLPFPSFLPFNQSIRFFPLALVLLPFRPLPISLLSLLEAFLIRISQGVPLFHRNGLSLSFPLCRSPGRSLPL